MNQYEFLENHYQSDILVNELLTEFDLSSISASLKNKLSKLNTNVIHRTYSKYEENITKKLKEYDIDVNKIKKSAMKSAKDIYSTIHGNYQKNKSIDFTVKSINSKIMFNVSDVIKYAKGGFVEVVFLLILSLILILFINTVLLLILTTIFNVNMYLAYFFILLFIIEISSFSIHMVFGYSSKNETIVSGNFSVDKKAIGGISLKNMNENENEKIYFVKVLSKSFTNILTKFKK